MSKTVKRVMTVMMIGLVALLGAKAEAHTRWFNGKPRVCSICDDDATLMEVPNGLYQADLIVKTQLVTILCPGTVELKSRKEWTLIGQSAPIAVKSESGIGQVAFRFRVSDQPIVNFGFCGVRNGEPILPDLLQITKMSAKYKAYECNGFDPDGTITCSSKLLVSTMELNNCKVSPDAVPDAVPPDPASFYVCEKPISRHVHPTPTR